MIALGLGTACIAAGVAFSFVRRREAALRSEAEFRRHAFIGGPLYAALERHDDALARRLSQLAWRDAYGNWVTTKWRKELDYFFDATVRPHLDRSVTPEEVRRLREDLRFRYEPNSDCLDPFWLDEYVDQEPTIAKISNDGLAFEKRIGAQLTAAGYDVSFTPATGDQGVDLVAERGAQRLVVQCKDYGGPVGNHAVQQVYAGAAYYGASRAAVLAPNGFTTAARQLASSLGVLCLHPSELSELAN